MNHLTARVSSSDQDWERVLIFIWSPHVSDLNGEVKGSVIKKYLGKNGKKLI